MTVINPMKGTKSFFSKKKLIERKIHTGNLILGNTLVLVHILVSKIIFQKPFPIDYVMFAPHL